MATDGSICSFAGVQCGLTYQRQTQTTAAMWLRMDAGDVAETDTTYDFSVGGAFAYNGYDNYIPYKAGYIAFKQDNTSYAHEWQTAVITRSLQANMGKDNELYARFSVTKPSYPIGIVPYFMVGTVYRYSSDGIAGNYWSFGNEYGTLTMESYVDKYGGGEWSYTANGTTMLLNCFKREGNNGMSAWNYDGACVYIRKPAIYVYDSSGKPHGTNKLYVYNSSGVPKLAKSITVYDSNGKPHTTQLN